MSTIVPEGALPFITYRYHKVELQVSWQPKELAVFAGRIDYKKYRFWDRQIIRFIMWITKGPTNPQAVVEFTDWNKVDDFGRTIAGM